MDRTTPLVASVRAFSEDKSIILTLGTKTFKELLSCKNADTNPILIVAEATKHDKETNDTKMVCYAQFTVLMLLIQDEPHLIIPGNKTNQNLHLGYLIRDENYGEKSFDSYMRINVNRRLVPITDRSDKLVRKLKFHSYYNTKDAGARSS